MCSGPEKKHLDALKKYFGHSEFRPMQWQIIRSLIEERRDNCVVMATGYGKSLCYQYPPVYRNGIGVVVSPLISLMQDQVLAMQMCNIPACLLGSAQSAKNETTINIMNGKYRLVYVTPEWCDCDFNRNLLVKLSDSGNLVLVAIDEAHCVSQWGMDFRKSYRKLSLLRLCLKNVPFLTVTATATPQVIDDICSALRLRNPALVKTSFDRPNLFLSVSLKGENLISDIRPLMEQGAALIGQSTSIRVTPPTIIYCPTKKTCDKVYSILSDHGYNCSVYHADLGLKMREQVHHNFVKDKVPIVIATIAFGMGIDKPDVRVIIHYGAPKEIESYYQEIGRAGRDGQPSICHVFYAQADFNLNRMFFSSLNGSFREHKEEMARLMEKYLQTRDCRRKMLLSHFDDSLTLSDNPRCCDNCSKGLTETDKKNLYDLTEDALLLLKAVKPFSGRYGLSVPIFMLLGSMNKRLPKEYYKHELFGKGSLHPEKFWKCLGRLLLGEGLLMEQASNFGHGWNKNRFPVSVMCISKLGHQYIAKKGEGCVTLEVTPEMMKMIRPKERFTSDNWMCSQFVSLESDGNHVIETIDPASMAEKTTEVKVYEGLFKLRGEIALELDCMPYMVCSNRVLMELSKKRPTEVNLLSNYDGFTEVKIKKFGHRFIDCIKGNGSTDAVNLLTDSDSSDVQPPPPKKFFKKTMSTHQSSQETVSLVSCGLDKLNKNVTELEEIDEHEEPTESQPMRAEGSHCDSNSLRPLDTVEWGQMADDDFFTAIDEKSIAEIECNNMGSDCETEYVSLPPAEENSQCDIDDASGKVRFLLEKSMTESHEMTEKCTETDLQLILNLPLPDDALNAIELVESNLEKRNQPIATEKDLSPVRSVSSKSIMISTESSPVISSNLRIRHSSPPPVPACTSSEIVAKKSHSSKQKRILHFDNSDDDDNSKNLVKKDASKNSKKKKKLLI